MKNALAVIHASSLLALVALTGCVGDECDVDADCLSNSCTWGSCDSALVNRAFENEHETPEPEPEPTCHDTDKCTWLLRDECAATKGCQPQSFCSGSLDCHSWEKDCPELC